MAVTLDAVGDLRGMGFSHAYLILDDHPPLGKCHADFLNRLLPAEAQRLGAAYVGLLGYGQHRRAEGEILENLFLERTPPTYRWRFSLHPGLWALEALEVFLRLRMSQYPLDAHTPWNFERHRDDPGQASPLTQEFFSCRVNGAAYDAAPGRVRRVLCQAALHGFFDLALFLVRLTRGRIVRERMSARWLWAYSYYRGPYPLFWSGVMMQGKANPHLARFLRHANPGDFPESLASVHKRFLA